ncbi:MAG: TIGR04149 family rSAM-modified RiPP [Bacteroidetes bacterium]|nr:TIGR04149 family rSAM-modified RiPP [Bacteroidota bacterium]
MKKLKNLKLDALKEVLSREQMKKITGGYSCPGQPCSSQRLCCPGWNCHRNGPTDQGICTLV